MGLTLLSTLRITQAAVLELWGSRVLNAMRLTVKWGASDQGSVTFSLDLC